jgi:hypothetical protein
MSRTSICRSAGLCLLASLAASTAHAAGYTHSYLVHAIALPTTNAEANTYAIDLDGDDAPDNQLGNVFGALASQGLDFNDFMNAAVASGSIVHRIDVESTDAAFANDPDAQATWCVAAPLAMPPLFDGTDATACADTSGIFHAALSAGSFTSPAPATTPNPVSLDVKFAIDFVNVTLPLLNTRLAFTIDAAGNMPFGQVNGAIPHDAIQNFFLPAYAQACNESIQTDPTSDLAMSCIGLFDDGCSGSPEYADDGQIEFCEMTESSFLQTLFAPDMQVDGIDAISVGFRFTAVGYDRVFASGFEP